MNPNQTAAYKILETAQQALKRGEKRLARQYAEQAARLAPEIEEVWLMLAALATPRGSVAFLERALQINPESERATKGMAWARNRLQKEPPRKTPTSAEKTAPIPVKPASAPAALPPTQPLRPAATVPVATRPRPSFQPGMAATAQAAKTAPTQVKKPGSPSRSIYAVLLIVVCLVAAAAILLNVSPVAAFINGSLFHSQPVSPAQAQVDLPQPTDTALALPNTPADTQTATPAPTFPSPQDVTPTLALPTFTSEPTSTSEPLPQAEAPSLTPTDSPTPAEVVEAASPTPLPTDTAEPGPTQYVPTPSGDVSGTGAHWIDVDLTHQMLYAYEGNNLVGSFVVSTGTWQYPTVTGQYHVYIKYLYKDMSGPGYYLPNVPYTMFFHQGYAIHGTYWHSNFGTPMSHGCVNMTIPDSEWIYNFSSVGTLVNVHY